MYSLEKNGHKILVYKTSEELPIKRYARFNKFNILESGVGSDITSIGLHFSKLFEYLSYKMTEEALTETKNLYYNIFSLLEEIPVIGMAFACLTHSIDDEPVTDISDDNLKIIVGKLSDIGLTAAEVREQIEEVKKKSSMN